MGDYSWGGGDEFSAVAQATPVTPDVSGLETGYGGGMIATAAPEPVVPDASAGAGLWSGLSNVRSGFGDVAKTLLPFAQLGLGGLSIAEQTRAANQAAAQTKLAQQAGKTQAQQATQLTETAQPLRTFSQEQLAATGPRIEAAGTKIDTAGSQLQAIAQPIADFSKSELDLGVSGKIPPQIQAQIDQWKQAELQKARDYLARAGLGDSSAMVQMEQLIDQKALAMAAEFLQSEENQGITAGQVAGGLIGQSGQLGVSAGQLGVAGGQLGISAGGTAGNILSQGSGAAAGSGASANQQQMSIEALLADANKWLAAITGGT